MEVYLDNSSTTRCYPEVQEIVIKTMTQDYGNPSSMHKKGMDGERYVKRSREILAGLLKVKDKEIIFTSGGTESDNLAIIGGAATRRRAGNHIITTEIEHPAVKEPVKYLESRGLCVTYLSVDKKGRISLKELEEALREDTILVSIIHVNNEIGSVQPIEEAAAIIKKKNKNILFHVDAIQSFGKYHIYPKKIGIDLLSISGHKFHGPKGIGVLYIHEKVNIPPLIFGGGQQQGIRSGTENVPGAAGLGEAAKIVYENFEEKREHLYCLKKKLIGGLKEIEGLVINGFIDPITDTAPHIISVSVEGVKSEVLLHALEEKGVYVSAGSACSSNKKKISETLKAIGLSKKLLDSTIRFSFSEENTLEEGEYAVKCMKEVIPVLRKYVGR